MTRSSPIALARAARRAALLGALLVLAPRTAAAAGPDSFTLDVSPRIGTQNDTFVVTVSIEVPGLSGPERYWNPDFTGFTVLDSQLQSTTSMQHDPVKGRQLKVLEVRRYFLQPKRLGRLRIGEAKILLGGQQYETRSVVVEVKSASAPGAGGSPVPVTRPGPFDDPTLAGGIGVPGFVPPSPDQRKDLFLHVVTDKQKAYVGEQVIVTWLLYTKTEILKFEPRPPALDGLWSEKLYEPDNYFRYHEDVVRGVPYEVAIVSKRAIFPTRPGTVTVPPLSASVSTLYTPLGQAESVESAPVELTVEPLPEGAPPDFDPTYVGVFTVSAAVDRARVDAGESMTLTVTVRGEGALRRTTPPRLDVPGFSFRAPRDFEESVDTSTDIIRGERVYRYWATPQTGGEQSIPPVTVPYFNPRTARYEVASSEPISIAVSGDPSQLDIDDASRENVIARDIRVLRTGTTLVSRSGTHLYHSPWVWLLAALPLLAFAGLVVTDRVRERLRKDTPRSRMRRARGRARKRFRVAEIHVRGERPAKFFGELARVIHEFIEERVGQPVGGLTQQELRGFLASKGFDEDTIASITDELERCDFARFAPSAAGPGEMRAALRRVKDLLKRIARTRPVEGDAEVEG